MMQTFKQHFISWLPAYALMGALGLGFLSIGYGLSTMAKDLAPNANLKRLVCFDSAGKFKFSIKEYNIRYDGEVIRASNNGNLYTIYPQPGWLCSIVDEPKPDEEKPE